MRVFLVLLVLLMSAAVSAQGYLRPNEKRIYSFQTQNGKQVFLVMDSSGKYMLYRFGTKSKIEFKYPTEIRDSWNKFTYTFYLRGGGPENEGMDLNYISFYDEGFRYVVYDTYHAVGGKYKVGVLVTDLKTGKTTDLKGDPKTTKGSMIDFRDNGKLKIGDELFN